MELGLAGQTRHCHRRQPGHWFSYRRRIGSGRMCSIDLRAGTGRAGRSGGEDQRAWRQCSRSGL